MTFGEAMMRLSTTGFERFEQASDYKMELGGAEANVAVGAARLGLFASWISLLPENSIGFSARNKIRMTGVDTSWVKFSKKGRMGLYFVEFGANPRRTKVLYDRENSSIRNISLEDFNFQEILKTRLFHMSGITPALSTSCEKATKEAILAAKANGALVSFDVNYRHKLWTGSAAKTVLEPLMKHVDILITTEEDIEIVFGITGETFGDSARKLQKKFGFKVVVITVRENISVWKNLWTAIAFDGNEIYTDRKYKLEIVDRFGGGDSFTAGFIYGYLEKNGNVQEALKYGNAFSALKHTNPSDFSWASLEEVESLLIQKTLRVER